MATKPLIVIVGPTASGKTSLAIDLAERIVGEIICADSRTVYRYMDIGTAKPSVAEQSRVPHWGLDLVDPDTRFTVVDFKKYAMKKIDEIRSRGHVPILDGGTRLYVDAVIFDYQFGSQPDQNKRKQYELMTIEELQKYCYNNNIQLPENDKNKRYVIRAIERNGESLKRRDTPIDNTIIVGIATDKHELYQRIEQRSNDIFEQNIIEEARQLANNYGWGHESMTGNIYPLCQQYIEGKITHNDLVSQFNVMDRKLAKRQMTWLRRNPYIHWIERDLALDRILSLLASEQ